MSNAQCASAEYLFCYVVDTVVYTFFIFQCVLFNIPLIQSLVGFFSSYLSFLSVRTIETYTEGVGTLGI